MTKETPYDTSYPEAWQIPAVREYNMTDAEIEAYLERAAIIEIDGGRTREDAERVALRGVLDRRRK